MARSPAGGGAAGGASAAAAVSVIAEVVSALADLPGAIQSAAGVFTQFVEAFAPATVERMSYAFRSLSATIGYALEPAVQTVTRVVEMFANAISSGMDKLRPAVEKVGAVFISVLEPVLGLAGELLEMFAEQVQKSLPLLDVLSVVLQAITQTARFTNTVLFTIAEALGGLFDPFAGLRTAATFLVEVFVGAAGVVLHFTDAVARMVGLGKVMDKVIDRLLLSTQAGRRQGAPEGFGMGGLEDIYRRRLTEAARSGGPSKEDEALDLQRRIKEILEDIRELSKNPPAQAARDEGLRQGFRVGAAANLGAFGAGADALLRQEGRNGLRQNLLPPAAQAALQQLGFL